MITAKVICDSINRYKTRITTLQLRYPRMVHADFMTHRVFSRNGRSSRAVPFSVLVKETPYVPHFMKNQPGMVASEELSVEEFMVAEQIWLDAATECQKAAQKLADIGVHKQWINRMLEWFGYIDVLVTSTDWANFFALRLDEGAQPEIRQLAGVMETAMEQSTPNPLTVDQWHLPYVDLIEDSTKVAEYLGLNWSDTLDNDVKYDPVNMEYIRTSPKDKLLEVLKKISVARCARLTIKPFDGDGSIEKELARYDKLMVSRPVHASPAEHIATPDYAAKHKEEWGNFHGWRQFRKMIPYNTVYDR